ncbi:dihydrolipoamide acetyltransferase family protein [Desertimonas flava]|uniref:dihydrolipoamide acetyltransferase family protein n=1 Tax=Desertimonas flava TaxID=2064846 RepID=UPI0019693FCB|nr:dihydrolipoamide acetyltransferase family protein [Desertimonas flava]
MAIDFTMPKLGLTMEEGTILEWLVPDGSEVVDGAPVLVIQTDKVETEVNVIGSGRLVQVAAIGDTLACGDVVGRLLADGETASGSDAGPAPSSAAPAPVTAPAPSPASLNGQHPADPAGDTRRFVSPNARRVAAELGVDIAAVRGTGPGGRVVSEDVEEFATRSPEPAPVPAATAPTTAVAPSSSGPTGSSRPFGGGSTVAATFAARSLADLLGIAEVAADPRDGRVSRDDVARHVRQLLAQRSAAPATPSSAAAEPSQTPTHVEPMRGIRGTIARRMHQSLQEMAQLTLTTDADVDAVLADRARRKKRAAKQAKKHEGTGKEVAPVPGITDYVIAAAARALRDHPHVNAQITPDGVAYLPGIHVGLAVALPGGLVVPVVRNADELSLADLTAETTRLATAARAGKLALDDLEGGTFSVTALGMFGVDAFTPVINPPNVAILGVGRIREELVPTSSGPATVHRATLSLTWDHRAFDGVPAAEFAQAVVANLADLDD